MGFVIVTVGLILIVTGAKDTHASLGRELVSDFIGPGNFTYWFAAIGFIGALGYAAPFKTFSRMFLALIIIAMLLSNQAFFARLQQALQQGPQRTAQPDPVSSTDPSPDVVRFQHSVLPADFPTVAAAFN